MFDLDLGKMVLFGAVALIVIGPRDLPAALRVAGRFAARLQRLKREIRDGANELMRDDPLAAEMAAIEQAARLELARNPSTAMRGSLTPASPGMAQAEALAYATPEMQAYLSEAADATPPRLEAMQEAQ